MNTWQEEVSEEVVGAGRVGGGKKQGEAGGVRERPHACQLHHDAPGAWRLVPAAPAAPQRRSPPTPTHLEALANGLKVVVGAALIAAQQPPLHHLHHQHDRSAHSSEVIEHTDAPGVHSRDAPGGSKKPWARASENTALGRAVELWKRHRRSTSDRLPRPAAAATHCCPPPLGSRRRGPRQARCRSAPRQEDTKIHSPCKLHPQLHPAPASLAGRGSPSGSAACCMHTSCRDANLQLLPPAATALTPASEAGRGLPPPARPAPCTAAPPPAAAHVHHTCFSNWPRFSSLRGKPSIKNLWLPLSSIACCSSEMVTWRGKRRWVAARCRV